MAMGQVGSSECRLSKDDFRYLKENTNYSEDVIKEWYTGFISDCPSGKLSQPSFIKIYSKFFPSGNATAFCEHIFRTFDADQNGYIDFKEFLLAINITSNGSADQKLDWAFSMYDVNGNGSIDLQEMTQIVRSIYHLIGKDQISGLVEEETPESRAATIFRIMDINADGRVTRNEFVQTCSKDQNLLNLLSPNMKL